MHLGVTRPVVEMLPLRNRNRAPALLQRTAPWQPAPVSDAKPMPDLDTLRFRANPLLELLQSDQGGADVASELAEVPDEQKRIAAAPQRAQSDDLRKPAGRGSAACRILYTRRD
jgi:hypothetical protein